MPMRQLVCFASAAVLAGAIFAGTMSDKAQAEEQWWPFKANDWVGDTATAVDYVPLSPDEVTKKWHLCVLVPHMKDSVWVSINYGHVREARRLGVQLTVFEAGGYPNLTRQLAQYDDCVALGVDAIVFSAISEEGLTRKVQAGRETAPVSLVDVLPTVLEWVGVEPLNDLDGVSLLPNFFGQESISERTLLMESPLYGRPHTSVLHWPFKMIVDVDDMPMSIVDLDHDPFEQKNILASHAAVAETMTATLHELRRAAARGTAMTPDEAATPSGEILERLRSLGYVR